MRPSELTKRECASSGHEREVAGASAASQQVVPGRRGRVDAGPRSTCHGGFRPRGSAAGRAGTRRRSRHGGRARRGPGAGRHNGRDRSRADRQQASAWPAGRFDVPTLVSAVAPPATTTPRPAGDTATARRRSDIGLDRRRDGSVARRTVAQLRQRDSEPHAPKRGLLPEVARRRSRTIGQGDRVQAVAAGVGSQPRASPSTRSASISRSRGVHARALGSVAGAALCCHRPRVCGVDRDGCWRRIAQSDLSTQPLLSCQARAIWDALDSSRQRRRRDAAAVPGCTTRTAGDCRGIRVDRVDGTVEPRWTRQLA